MFSWTAISLVIFLLVFHVSQKQINGPFLLNWTSSVTSQGEIVRDIEERGRVRGEMGREGRERRGISYPGLTGPLRFQNLCPAVQLHSTHIDVKNASFLLKKHIQYNFKINISSQL